MKIKLNIKNVLILAILAIIITSISLFFINTSLATNMAKVTVQTANLREKASSDSKILEQIGQGDSVEILETSGGWYKVKHNNITGYLRNDLVSLENTESTTQDQQNNTQNESENNTIEDNLVNNENETNLVETEKQYKVKENVKLKIVPLINALDVTEINSGTQVKIIDTMNYWAYVEVEGNQGWVVLEKLENIENNDVEKQDEEEQPENNNQNESENNTVNETTENTTTSNETVENTTNSNETSNTSTVKYINSETVNVRRTADRTSDIIVQVAINTEVKVLSESNGWSKVSVDGVEGYILSSLLSDRKQETSRGATNSRLENNTVTDNSNETSNENTQQNNESSVTGANVVAYAKQFIGIPYKYGGTSPSTGFDCSGFTSYVYKHFGITLPRTSGGQSSVGKAVSKANLQLGDIVVYNGHVAIYVGGGNVIHAPRPGKSVCIVGINNAGYGYSGGRRVID